MPTRFNPAPGTGTQSPSWPAGCSAPAGPNAGDSTGEILQVVGAVLILAAFGTAQAGRLSQRSATYLVLNLAGAAILAGVAADEADWGFLLLEGAWTLLSLWGLVQLARGRRPAGAH